MAAVERPQTEGPAERDPLEVRMVKEARQDRDALKRAHHTLGGVNTPRMNGDNLAILLCTYFDNPEQVADDETGWTPDAVAGCDEVLAAIRLHYETVK